MIYRFNLIINSERIQLNSEHVQKMAACVRDSGGLCRLKKP